MKKEERGIYYMYKYDLRLKSILLALIMTGSYRLQAAVRSLTATIPPSRRAITLPKKLPPRSARSIRCPPRITTDILLRYILTIRTTAMST